ncbi:hypothetical protein KJ855_04350, partial [Patescibacteria group bacterium]|nr:hypothetical protein [Patescibacteria group bacterium]
MKINVEGFSSIDQNPEIRWWDNELWIKEIEKKEGLKIIHNPTTRRKFIDRQLYIDGITDKERKPIKENIDNAYLPISLTNTPVGLQFLATFLQNSTKTILDKCNIRHYDPHTAPFSPDKNLSVGPDD